MERKFVIGAGGLVGSRFCELVPNTVDIKDETDLDITDQSAIKDRLENFEGTVINFAAITAVDKAEEQRGDTDNLVWQVNAQGAENVAQACGLYDLPLIHISTDFVFPGTVNYPGPYPEDAQLPDSENQSQPPEDLSWYGYTKLIGEQKVRQADAKAAIVRISYPFRADYPPKLDFARNILHLYDQDKLYPMFEDQAITPTYIDELVGTLERIIDQEITGTFHVASTTTTSPAEFAAYLIKQARGDDQVVEKGSMEEYLSQGDKTPRPRLGGLETTQTEQNLGIRLQTWQKSVDQLVVQLKEKT